MKNQPARRVFAGLWICFALLLCVVTAPSPAESLASVKPVALPALAVDTPLDAMAVVEGRVVAIRGSDAWTLNAGLSEWQRSSWQPPSAAAAIQGVVGDGRQAYQLRGSAAVESVQRLFFDEGGLAGGSAVALPMPLLQVRGAMHGSVLFLLMFVAVWIVPLLRRLDLMSVFSYLETRFHSAIRMLASAMCIVMQIGSPMSVVLFLPALAIATITGIDVVWSVMLMGVVTILYTTMGGMKAVIWTDFVQVLVIMGGALFAIGFIVYQINGGFDEFHAVAMAENKTHLFDFSFDLTKATVWGFIFLVLFDVVVTFPKDQVLMQRTLSTKCDKDAGRSIWAFAAIMIPGGFIFYTIGTDLFVFYKTHTERMDPLLPIDATFPLFIAAELPMGVTGLMIAGIFAAAMSTLSSIMNSVATLASIDFHDKLVKKRDPAASVRFA
ncbi:MAG: hypothetical protein ABIQ36_09005 [Rhodanobacter sp.]